MGYTILVLIVFSVGCLMAHPTESNQLVAGNSTVTLNLSNSEDTLIPYEFHGLNFLSPVVLSDEDLTSALTEEDKQAIEVSLDKFESYMGGDFSFLSSLVAYFLHFDFKPHIVYDLRNGSKGSVEQMVLRMNGENLYYEQMDITVDGLPAILSKGEFVYKGRHLLLRHILIQRGQQVYGFASIFDEKFEGLVQKSFNSLNFSK